MGATARKIEFMLLCKFKNARNVLGIYVGMIVFRTRKTESIKLGKIFRLSVRMSNHAKSARIFYHRNQFLYRKVDKRKLGFCFVLMKLSAVVPIILLRFSETLYHRSKYLLVAEPAVRCGIIKNVLPRKILKIA